MSKKRIELFKRVNDMLSKVNLKLGRAELADGTLIEWEGDLEEGKEVYVVTEEGLEAAPNGEHVTVDGVVITTAEGQVTEIEDPEEVEETEEEQPSEEMDEKDKEEKEDYSEETEETEAEEEFEEVEETQESEEEFSEETEEDYDSYPNASNVPDPNEEVNTLDGGNSSTKFSEMEAKVKELEDKFKELFSSHEEYKEKLNKLSSEPAIEEEKQTVSNGFNKTQKKSRAAQILQS